MGWLGPVRTISDASREGPAGRCRGGLGLRRAGAGEQIPRTAPSWRAVTHPTSPRAPPAPEQTTSRTPGRSRNTDAETRPAPKREATDVLAFADEFTDIDGSPIDDHSHPGTDRTIEIFEEAVSGAAAHRQVAKLGSVTPR
ncbi:MAG: hypothetical protein ACRDRU_13565 [Pseudonocardiaceae bacterium]